VSDYEVQATGLQILDRKVFAAGETIFREGETGSRAYVIQRGHVDIIKEIDDEKITVGTVGPGGIFGEMALIDDKPRMASAIVSDYCVCIIITSEMF
jgi:CRP/FNR family cyclic AMP-dependent transcriptional regulator